MAVASNRPMISPPPPKTFNLDFTFRAPTCTDIAVDFDPESFADTLERAHVDSVTCFARCHHGYIYYDTKKNPERKHPHLKRHLLEEQIEACHSAASGADLHHDPVGRRSPPTSTRNGGRSPRRARSRARRPTSPASTGSCA